MYSFHGLCAGTDRAVSSWPPANLDTEAVWAYPSPTCVSRHIQQVDDSLLGSKAVTLVAVGDIMLDRGVRQAMNRHGLTHPFEGTQQVLSSADIAFANLETPISSRGNPLNMFRAYPDVMKALRYSGLDVVSIANNHILDYDYIALYDTIEYLDTAGIRHVGAGANEAAARRHKVIESNGLRIAFLAYTELWFCYTKDNRDVDATESRPGVAPLREDVLVEDVARAKADSDFVVVSCHWGEEIQALSQSDSAAFRRGSNSCRRQPRVGASSTCLAGPCIRRLLGYGILPRQLHL